MTAAVKHLVEEPFRLAPEEREELVGANLNQSKTDGQWLAVWTEEIEKRAKEVLAGKCDCVSADDAHRQVRQAISKMR